MKQINNPRPPTISILEEFTRQWNETPKYMEQNRILTRLYQQDWPLNTDLEKVIIKVTILDSWWSTRVKQNIYDMANQIISLQADTKIGAGDKAIVNLIAMVNGINHISFATKYCHHHNPNGYAIYDSFVKAVLKYFQRTTRFFPSRLTDNHFKDFLLYDHVIDAFKKHFKIHDWSYRDLDRYLWYEGKICFEYPSRES